MAVAVGDRAPDFTLKNADLEEVSLSSMRGKNVVVLFSPLAFTSVCTEEFCGVSAGIDDYKGLDAEVLGISVDSPFSLQAWAERKVLRSLCSATSTKRFRTRTGRSTKTCSVFAASPSGLHLWWTKRGLCVLPPYRTTPK